MAILAQGLVLLHWFKGPTLPGPRALATLLIRRGRARLIGLDGYPYCAQGPLPSERVGVAFGRQSLSQRPLGYSLGTRTGSGPNAAGGPEGLPDGPNVGV